MRMGAPQARRPRAALHLALALVRAAALETYKTTGQLPPMEASELTRFNDFAKNKGQDPAKRRKKGANITLCQCVCA